MRLNPLIPVLIFLPTLLQSCKTVDVLQETKKVRQQFVYVTQAIKCTSKCVSHDVGEFYDFLDVYRAWSPDPSAIKWNQQSREIDVANQLCQKISMTENQFKSLLAKEGGRIQFSEDWSAPINYFENRFNSDKKYAGRGIASYAECIGKKYLIEVGDGTRLEVIGTKTVPFWDNTTYKQRTDHAR